LGRVDISTFSTESAKGGLRDKRSSHLEVTRHLFLLSTPVCGSWAKGELRQGDLQHA
jgi:hypothetical protein